MRDNYLNFMENHLGKIEYGWSKDENGNELPFQVVKYVDGPFPGTVTYSTVGLSNILLKSHVSIKNIRQELVFVSYSSFGDKNIPAILQHVGLQAYNNGIAYLRGESIGPKGKIFNDSNLKALYVTLPVYFDDSFHTFYEKDGDPIVNVWLVPISNKEAEFVKLYGWDKFEDLLVEKDPDLINFKRKSIIE
ncbi:suppressor of fused domain protein [Rossellomorea sp. SC111]|uniref:suppressor of fused domain protein n=1 Tax=Rossellomorea sp. SC111 TaxID=2968985 RepID=UPI00215ABA93|nr:suppressor of fused domain protein [Rossellomorea sp. SC111]MCR8851117.1 suppressor of fused domain protein [Rossellomorea sp. SC111]